MKFLRIVLSLQLMLLPMTTRESVATDPTWKDMAKSLASQIAMGFVFETELNGKKQELKNLESIPQSSSPPAVYVSHPKNFSNGLQLGISISPGKKTSEVMITAYRDGEYITGRNMIVKNNYTNEAELAQAQSHFLITFNSFQEELRLQYGLSFALNGANELESITTICAIGTALVFLGFLSVFVYKKLQKINTNPGQAKPSYFLMMSPFYYPMCVVLMNIWPS